MPINVKAITHVIIFFITISSKGNCIFFLMEGAIDSVKKFGNFFLTALFNFFKFSSL